MILPSLSLSVRTSTYIQHLAHIRDHNHILKIAVFNDFKINILITGSLFTTSTIKWQWYLYFIAYSNYSAVKPSKPLKFLLMIFFCFMPAVIMSEIWHHHCVSNRVPPRGIKMQCTYWVIRYVNTVEQEKILIQMQNAYLATLYTFYKKIIRKQALFYIYFFSCYWL